MRCKERVTFGTEYTVLLRSAVSAFHVPRRLSATSRECDPLDATQVNHSRRWQRTGTTFVTAPLSNRWRGSAGGAEQHSEDEREAQDDAWEDIVAETDALTEKSYGNWRTSKKDEADEVGPDKADEAHDEAGRHLLQCHHVA